MGDGRYTHGWGRVKRKGFELEGGKKIVNKPCVKNSVQKETGLVRAEGPQERDSGGD